MLNISKYFLGINNEQNNKGINDFALGLENGQSIANKTNKNCIGVPIDRAAYRSQLKTFFTSYIDYTCTAPFYKKMQQISKR